MSSLIEERKTDVLKTSILLERKSEEMHYL